jgi:hypothetical protein
MSEQLAAWLTVSTSLMLRMTERGLHCGAADFYIGSALQRLEPRGEVWVVSGDCKTEPDPTCTRFEPVRCHTFITASTFGLEGRPSRPSGTTPRSSASVLRW